MPLVQLDTNLSELDKEISKVHQKEAECIERMHVRESKILGQLADAMKESSDEKQREKVDAVVLGE